MLVGLRCWMSSRESTVVGVGIEFAKRSQIKHLLEPRPGCQLRTAHRCIRRLHLDAWRRRFGGWLGGFAWLELTRFLAFGRRFKGLGLRGYFALALHLGIHLTLSLLNSM